MATKVYKYGLLAPIEGAELVQQQMLNGHRYRNTLVEIERGRRAAIRHVNTQTGDIAAFEARVTETKRAEHEAAQAIRATRQETRNRSETDEMRARLQTARLARREAVQALKERRKAIREDETVRLQSDEVNERAGVLVRSARAHSATYWGTYLLHEAAMEQARKAPLYDGDEPNDPRFARWTGEGRIGIQLQGGLSATDAFGEDTRVRVGPVDERAWLQETARGERRRLSRTTLMLRVGSDEKKRPVWAKWPMIMHRPFPEGAIIKTTTVSRRRIGPREEWSVEFTVTFEEGKRHTGSAHGRVAINVGFRQMGTHIRVAYWHDDEGGSGELLLPQEIISGIRKADELRGIRDRNFDKAKTELVTWLRGREDLPGWLLEARTHMHVWRSATRLAGIIKRWAKARFEGDTEGFEAAEKWRYHDFHLWQWESDQRAKSLRRRREHFRMFSALLRERYITCVLDDFDLRKVARRAAADKGPENETARSNRQLVALSELRQCIAHALPVEKVTSVSEQSTEAGIHGGSTHLCHACDHVNNFDPAPSIEHTCVACGVTWDQDDNAAINLLRHGERRRGDQTNAQPTETKWAKSRRLSNEKKGRLQSARTALASAAE